MRQPVAKDETVFHPDPVRNAIFTKMLGNDSTAAIRSPQALALRVELSKESFLKMDKPPEDIRVDVFFNGQLTHSTLWPKRFYHEDNKQSQLLNVFSGRRTQWMCERAWVIVPPGQDPDGSRRRPVVNAETTEDRWDRIQQELLKEVEARGVDERGNIPFVAKYLTEVSKLAMPPELRNWCDLRGQQFGVVDVVLSYGQGLKDSPAKIYISEPTRLRSSKFKKRTHAQAFSEDFPVSAENNSSHHNNRYNLRSTTPETSAAGKESSPIPRTPAGQKPSKTSSRSLPAEQTYVPSGPLVDERDKVISSSEQLPRYLKDKLIKKGYTLQVQSGLDSTDPSTPQVGKQPVMQLDVPHSLPFHTSKSSTTTTEVIDLEDEPDSPSNQRHEPRLQLSRAQRIGRRPLAPIVTQLEKIPEEEEDAPTSSTADAFTSSSGPSRSNQNTATESSFSSSDVSNQDSQSSNLQVMVSEDSAAGLPSPRGSLLPPVQIHTGVRARRIALQDDEGSPRKKRRLSENRALNIKVPEGFGINQRGVFVPLGSPNDKSKQRSKFNSFTLGTNVYPDQDWAPRRRPPVSPITPDQSSSRKQDPLINRLVIKHRDTIICSFGFSTSFRKSDIPSTARSARDRSAATKRAWDNTRALNPPATPQTQSSFMLPPTNRTTPGQDIAAPFSPRPAPPHTPVPNRIRTRSASIDSAATTHGGIYNTPAPLPRYNSTTNRPPQPTTSPYFQPPPPRTPTTQTTPLSCDHPRTPAIRTPASSATSRRSRGMQSDDPAHPHAQMERAFRAFDVPDLSQDCAITYAMPAGGGAAAKAWVAGEARGFGGGVVRQVRSERTGEFEEDGVVVGVRFVVV